MAFLCMFVAAPTGVVRRAWEEMRAGVEGVKGRGGKEGHVEQGSLVQILSETKFDVRFSNGTSS